ncbi:MAG: O-antigen ligase family protein [Candidatus Moranbacteria bacterium]|nr:O-antigen ligase family protein [Candidatus Moranbacteria bacterium]
MPIIPSKISNPQKNSRLYAYVLIFAVIFFLTGILFGQLAGNIRLVMGAFIFMFLSALAFWDMKKVLWTILFFLPLIFGLSNYQINISSFFQGIVNINDLYANPFSLTCLFLIFLATIELIRRGKKMTKIPLFFILLLSALLSVIVLLPSRYLTSGLVFEVYLLAGFSVYFLSYLFLGSKENYLKTIFVIIFSAIIPAGVGIFQFLTGNYFFENDSDLGRIAATFPHPNTFGSFLFVVLALFLITFFAIKLENKLTNFSKLIIYFFAAILGLLLILTYSRTAWSGLLVAVLAIFILKPRFRLLMTYCGLLLAGAVMLFEKTRERILGIFEHHMFDSMYGRYEIWDMALYRSWKKPFIGYGIGSFSEMIKDTQGKATGNVYPHNDLIRFFLEGGILGVTLYLLYLIGALYYSTKSFLHYPETSEKISFWGKRFDVELKTLGVIPLVLFGSTIVISMVESPSMDFTFQLLSWVLLGSWLGASREYWQKKS